MTAEARLIRESQKNRSRGAALEGAARPIKTTKLAMPVKRARNKTASVIFSAQTCVGFGDGRKHYES
jgi:hypothetical protein